MDRTLQWGNELTQSSLRIINLLFLSSIALLIFGIPGLLIGVVCLLGHRYFSTPVLVGVLAGMVILLSGSDASVPTLAGGIAVVFSPLMLAQKSKFSRTHRYLLVGSVVIGLLSLFIISTAGIVWPATIAVATVLLAVCTVIYWYTVPV